jgi:2-dehydro-3-deoxygalactonokinase
MMQASTCALRPVRGIRRGEVRFMNKSLLGIDWGTSNRRAYLVDGEGRCLARHSDDQGMLASRGRFAESLETLLYTMRVPLDTPVIMSGMVGSAQGWREVAYLDPEVPLTALPQYLAPLDIPGRTGTSAIVPGYCLRGERIDVMRGEETQLLGAQALGHGDGWVVLPGTHSKWVRLLGGRIVGWSTYMTGELFALLTRQGTLAPLLGAPSARDDEDAFVQGLNLARCAGPLSNALFEVRARVVSGALDPLRARSVASGLLIGTEFVANPVNGGTDRLTLVGSATLAERYETAARYFGRSVAVLDPDVVYQAALRHFLHEVP